jgi:hypothetical protein
MSSADLSAMLGPILKGMAAILRPFLRFGAQVGLATHEPCSGRMVDAQAQEAGGPQKHAPPKRSNGWRNVTPRIRPLVDGLSIVGWMMGAG